MDIQSNPSFSLQRCLNRNWQTARKGINTISHFSLCEHSHLNNSSFMYNIYITWGRSYCFSITMKWTPLELIRTAMLQRENPCHTTILQITLKINYITQPIGEHINTAATHSTNDLHSQKNVGFWSFNTADGSCFGFCLTSKVESDYQIQHFPSHWFLGSDPWKMYLKLYQT